MIISVFADGFKGIISIASDLFGEPADEVLRKFVRYYESQPMANGFWDIIPALAA